jgi:hypothetical protein
VETFLYYIAVQRYRTCCLKISVQQDNTVYFYSNLTFYTWKFVGYVEAQTSTEYATHTFTIIKMFE